MAAASSGCSSASCAPPSGLNCGCCLGFLGLLCLPAAGAAFCLQHQRASGQRAAVRKRHSDQKDSCAPPSAVKRGRCLGFLGLLCLPAAGPAVCLQHQRAEQRGAHVGSVTSHLHT